MLLLVAAALLAGVAALAVVIGTTVGGMNEAPPLESIETLGDPIR